MRRSFPIIAFVSAIALLVVARFTARTTLRRSAESSAAVDITYQALLALDDISLGVSEIISMSRGYLFTRLDVFLDPQEERTAQVYQAVTTLQDLFEEKPEQLARLDELSALIDRRLLMSEEYIQVRRNDGVQAALDAIPPGGAALVGQIRAQLDQIATVEVALLSEQRAAAAAVRRRAESTALLSGRLSLILLALAFFALLRQVKQRVQAEGSLHRVEERLRQSQRMEAVGRLASGVAHDFNNLLMVILGHSERLLRRLPASDPLRKSATAIGRGASLTDQLLALSRNQVLRTKLVDLNDAVRNLISIVSKPDRDNIDVQTHLAEDLFTVRVDPVQLDQVLLNLMLNAQDAMPDGGRVTVETRNVRVEDRGPVTVDEPPPGDYAGLTIRDTGIGIDDETRRHIFEPFFTTKESEGTGLGLATAYGIVRQSDGFISVKNARHPAPASPSCCRAVVRRLPRSRHHRLPTR